MVVENAFGCLKGRWQHLLKAILLQKMFQLSSQHAVYFYNICEVHKKQFDDTWLEELELGPTAPSLTQNASTNTNAENIRTALCNYMNL